MPQRITHHFDNISVVPAYYQNATLSAAIPETSDDNHTLPAFPYCFFLAITLTASVALNTCILWALKRRGQYNGNENHGKRHTSVGKRLLYNMCASSLGHSLGVIPFVVASLLAPGNKWLFPPVVCNLVGLIFTVLLSVSWLSEALIAYDRYVAIVHTMTYCQHMTNKAGKYILTTWSVGLAVAFLPAFLTYSFFSYDPNRLLCLFDAAHNAAYMVAFGGAYVLSVLCMIRCYGAVLREASKRKKLPPMPLNNNNSYAAATEVDSDSAVAEHDAETSGQSTSVSSSTIEMQRPRRLSAPAVPAGRNLSRASSSLSITSSTTTRSVTNPQPQQYLVSYRNSCKSLRTITIILIANISTGVPLLASMTFEYYLHNSGGSGQSQPLLPTWLIRWLTYWTFMKNVLTPLVYGFMNRSVRRDIMRAWRQSRRQRQAHNGVVTASRSPRRLSISSHLLDFVPSYQSGNKPAKPTVLSTSLYDESVIIESGSASASTTGGDLLGRNISRRRSLDDDCPPSSSSLANQNFHNNKIIMPKRPGGAATAHELLIRLERGRTQRLLSRRRASDQLPMSRAMMHKKMSNSNTSSTSAVEEQQIGGHSRTQRSVSRRGSAGSTGAPSTEQQSLTGSASFFSLLRMSRVAWWRRVSAPSCLQGASMKASTTTAEPVIVDDGINSVVAKTTTAAAVVMRDVNGGPAEEATKDFVPKTPRFVQQQALAVFDSNSDDLHSSEVPVVNG